MFRFCVLARRSSGCVLVGHYCQDMVLLWGHGVRGGADRGASWMEVAAASPQMMVQGCGCLTAWGITLYSFALVCRRHGFSVRGMWMEASGVVRARLPRRAVRGQADSGRIGQGFSEAMSSCLARGVWWVGWFPGIFCAPLIMLTL